MSEQKNQYQRDEENISYMYTFPPQEHVHFTIISPPPVVGYWVLPCHNTSYKTMFAGYRKPVWFHRMTMKWMLGWTWEDEK